MKPMKIVIIGGTGRVGSNVAGKLGKLGHTVIAAAPSTGVNSLTGEGGDEAMAGTDIVIDLSNSPSFEDGPALDFFIGTKAKPGAFYNGNYSIDYSLFKNFKIEAGAYYLTQLNQDSFNGNGHYYQETYGLATTKEHVLGYGPGLVLLTPNGVLIEAKVFFETDIQNRFSGNRPTLRLTIPLSK